MRVINGVGEAGWRLFTCESTVSTNDLARDLPPWNAVRADSQTGGRGRFGRVFVSDVGGLWISAVLPTPGEIHKWTGFSLMVGYHLLCMLENFSIPELRLRWPNDLMIGKRKVGGLLIEQSSRKTLIVGLGLNVCNSPWELMPELETTSINLKSVLREVPNLEEITINTLDALADAHKMMIEAGMSAAIEEFNRRLTVPLAIELILPQARRVSGYFAGLDPTGNLRLLDNLNTEFVVQHHSVEKLIEL